MYTQRSSVFIAPRKNRTINLHTQPPSMNDESVVDFYEGTGVYGYLSNFYCNVPFSWNGLLFKSSEHAFQTAKFMHDDSLPARTFMNAIREARTPNMARILANQKTASGYKWRTDMNAAIRASLESGVKIREDWAESKDSIMLSILMAKFFHQPTLLRKLQATKGALLREHTSRDRYWGDGGDGSGKNRLGRLLMVVRDEANRIVPLGA